jgi:hypothetical protein
MRAPYPVRKVVNFDRQMVDAINKWRHRQDAVPSANEAIRALIKRGLATAKRPQSDSARP